MCIITLIYPIFHRCFLSAGSPASHPRKSSLVEALLIKLCDRITKPRREWRARGKHAYTSRWRLVISEYNNICARLMSSQALLEGTHLMLFTINDTRAPQFLPNTLERCLVLSTCWFSRDSNSMSALKSSTKRSMKALKILRQLNMILLQYRKDPLTLFLPTDTESDSEEEAEEVNMSSYVLEIVHFFVAIALYLRISFVLQTIVDDGEEAVDSRGVAEWDKVDALAEALVSLRGLSVTSTQAEKLIELYANLPDFDKKPIIFNPQPHKPSRTPPPMQVC